MNLKIVVCDKLTPDTLMMVFSGAVSIGKSVLDGNVLKFEAEFDFSRVVVIKNLAPSRNG